MASIVKRPGRPKPHFVFYREPADKKLRAKAFKTRREAEAFRDTVSTEIRNGVYTDRRPVAFLDYAEDWLARTRATVRPSTSALHECAVRKHLVPAFGRTPIQNLTAEAIERWQADLFAAGKPGPRSVEICRTVLGTMLKDARKKGRLYVNPVENVRRFDVPKRELHYLSAAQVKDLCEQVGRTYGVLFLVEAFCGLRIGEATGLQWPDVDLSRRRLFVQRQVVWLRKRDCQVGTPRWRLVDPKTKAGVRVVEIPAVLVDFLTAHRAAQNGGPNPLGLVFPSRTGTPLYGKNVLRRHFQPALKAIGLSGIRQHDFRRTFIALHVEAGTHPKLVQERVGHSNIGLTMDVYGKVAGRMALSEAQAAAFDVATATAANLVNVWSTGPSATPHDTPRQPVEPKALSA